MSTSYPGAVVLSDQDNNIIYVLQLGDIVRFVRNPRTEVEIRATGRNVLENLHLKIAYTVVHNEPVLRFYDYSLHGTFVQSTQRYALFADNCNLLHEYANAVRHIRGSDTIDNVRVCELHLSRFLGFEQSRITLGELHSNIWYRIDDANEMFYTACLQGHTLRAHQLQYRQIASSLFFSQDKVNSMITAIIQGNNIKLLKLCCKFWYWTATMDHLLLAVQMAHVNVFKLVWQHRTRTRAYDTQLILKVAAAWQQVQIILYLGHTHGIAAKRDNVNQLQRQTSNVVGKLAIKMYAGPERLVDCPSKYVLAFLCIQDFPRPAIMGAVDNGKWPACSKMGCDTCNTLMQASAVSHQAFLQFLNNEFLMYPLLHPKPERYTICKDYLSNIVETRGGFNPGALKWFSKAGKAAVLAFFLANQRLRCTDVESLPVELHYKIASFTSHADWNTVF
jgi:hypothetical protein